jgi:hypothetical protein
MTIWMSMGISRFRNSCAMLLARSSILSAMSIVVASRAKMLAKRFVMTKRKPSKAVVVHEGSARRSW